MTTIDISDLSWEEKLQNLMLVEIGNTYATTTLVSLESWIVMQCNLKNLTNIFSSIMHYTITGDKAEADDSIRLARLKVEEFIQEHEQILSDILKHRKEKGN